MNDLSIEQRIPPAEIAKAEAMLTPEQSVMSRVRANILTPLDYMELPESQAQIIRDYSDKAAEVARSEFERLQKESPVKRLVDALTALTDEISFLPKHEEPFKDEKEEQVERDKPFIQKRITEVQSEVRNWQDKVTEAQGVAAIQGGTKTLKQIVIDQINIAEQQKGEIFFRSDRRGGIDPLIGIEISESPWRIETGKWSNPRTEQVLKRLGFIPEDASIELLFALPEYKHEESELNQLRWGGKPVKLNSRDVVGLKSETMPGVAAEISLTARGAFLALRFQPEAVVKSVAAIPAVSAT